MLGGELKDHRRHRHTHSDGCASDFKDIGRRQSGTDDWKNLILSFKEAERLRNEEQQCYPTSELEKENLHFYLSEALIAAIEQMKWRTVLNNHMPAFVYPVSPTGQRRLDQDAALQACSRPMSSTKDSSTSSTLSNYDSSGGSYSVLSGGGYYDDLSDECGPSVSSSCLSPALSDAGSLHQASGQDSCSASMLSPRRELAARRTRNVAQGPAVTSDLGSSIDSESRYLRSDSSFMDSSAEAIALALYASFAKKSPPTLADLKYMVTEREAPQDLLPLPDSFSVPTDEIYLDSNKVRLRGTTSWAPPRMKLILTLHPHFKKKDLLFMQQFQCGLCGTTLEGAYLKRIVYCDYLGRWMCQRCHGGNTAIIPARVLHRWDFKPYPVSDFAWKFLDRHMETPLYNIVAIRPDIYKRVKILQTMRQARLRLRFMWDYVRTCRTAAEVVTREGKLSDIFQKFPSHFLDDIEVYSLQDLIEVKSGSLLPRIDIALQFAQYHITDCDHCKAKGFICELCNDEADIIFPFEKRSIRCDGCGSCYHWNCRSKKAAACPKCIRIQHRAMLHTNSQAESSDGGTAHVDPTGLQSGGSIPVTEESFQSYA